MGSLQQTRPSGSGFAGRVKAKWPGVKWLGAGLAALGLSTLVAGCENVPRTLADQQPFYNPGLVQFTVEDGEMSTVIHGRPFGGDQFDSDRAVAGAMTLPGFYPQADFRPIIPGVRPEGGYVVFAFDPARPGLSAASLCKNPDPVQSQASDGALHLLGAFCYGDTLASNVSARTPRPNSAQDPAFREFMALVLADLLPPLDPNRGPGCQRSC